MVLSKFLALCVGVVVAATGTVLASPAAARADTCDVPTSGRGADLTVWGDSMAYGLGAGPSQTWHALLGTAYGVEVTNGGVPGERTSGIAARQGGKPATLTDRLTVPAAGVSAPLPFDPSADIVFRHIEEPLFELPGRLVDPSATPPVSVEGRLRKSRDGANSTEHRFERSSQGSRHTFRSGSYFESEIGVDHRGEAMIIWAGHNDFTDQAGSPDIDRIVAAVCAMVESNGVADYLVIGLSNGPSDPDGDGTPNPSGIGSQYYRTAIADDEGNALSQRLAALFGERFLDVRSALIAYRQSINRTDIPAWARCAAGTQEDNTDLAADIVPCSFRQANFAASPVDVTERPTVHLNPFGQCQAARIVRDRLETLGWFAGGGSVDCSDVAPPME